jgi:hypothetical protein
MVIAEGIFARKRGVVKARAGVRRGVSQTLRVLETLREGFVIVIP